MKTNILIIIGIAISIAAITYFLNTNDTYERRINEAPDKTSIQHTPSPTQTTPDFTFTTRDGAQYTARDFTGKIIVLNFWASWCAPCVKEFPDLLTIAHDYPDNVVFIGISSDMNQAAIDKFITKMTASHGLNFNGSNIYIALDNETNPIAARFQSYKLPETYVIDQNQQIRHKFIGANWTAQDLRTMIDDLAASL